MTQSRIKRTTTLLFPNEEAWSSMSASGSGQMFSLITELAEDILVRVIGHEGRLLDVYKQGVHTSTGLLLHAASCCQNTLCVPDWAVFYLKLVRK